MTEPTKLTDDELLRRVQESDRELASGERTRFADAESLSAYLEKRFPRANEVEQV